MSRQIAFLNPENFDTKIRNQAIEFLNKVFDGDEELFKTMVQNKQINLESSERTIITDIDNKIEYIIMGNCLGPFLYIFDIRTL